MQKKYLLLLIFFCCHVLVFGQYENVWVFSNNAGVDFSNSSPSVFSTPITYMGQGTPEANASVCDANGNFLFCTDGNIVYDRNYDTMLNGFPLLDSGRLWRFPRIITSTTTQGALIVPMPDSMDKYYVFSLTSSNSPYLGEDPRFKGRGGNLLYSVVDMKMNNGLGGVEPNKRGIFVDSALQEKLVSVVGDRCNVWVLACDNDGYFRAYEITASGVNTQPVISTVGIGSLIAAQGTIAVSPDRRKIASVQGAITAPINTWPNPNSVYPDIKYSDAALALFDFDAASGIVSNPVTLIPFHDVSQYIGYRRFNDSTGFSVCFSPDNSKLYYGSIARHIFQFDLSSGNPIVMANSKIALGATGTTLPSLKLAPDGKIYFLIKDGVTKASSLGRIASPNLAGAACQFLDTAFALIPKGAQVGNLPNVISVFKRNAVYAAHVIDTCGVDSILVAAIDTSGWDYIWNDGVRSAKRIINDNGTYWLQYYTSLCILHTDTFKVKAGVLPVPVITVNGFVLGTTQSYDTYQWYLNGEIIPGATHATYTVTENGDYTVVVRDKETGCIGSSSVYTVTNVTSINSANSLRSGIEIYPNPASDVVHILSPLVVNVSVTSIEGKVIKKIRNTKSIDIKGMADGIYLIHIFDQEGILLKVNRLVLKR